MSSKSLAARECLKVRVCGEVYHVDLVPDPCTYREYIRHKIPTAQAQGHEAFCAVDLGQLHVLYSHWRRLLPRVRPFFAVKAYSDPIILKILAAMGLGFDCASLAEIKAILDLGASPTNDIIYAHPCKLLTHLQYAAERNVDLMTFDCESELHKVKKYFKSARLVVRIDVGNMDCASPLGLKFGCTVAEAKCLLDKAVALGLNVVGTSFHVGCGCWSPKSYDKGIRLCAEVFEYGKSLGYNFTLLDIGGGFPGSDKFELFKEEAGIIRESLETYFNQEHYPSLTVIAEPGRYFTTSVGANAVSVVNTKKFQENGKPKYSYYITDGIYRSLANVKIDYFMEFIPQVLEDRTGQPTHKSIVWGPTCDSADLVREMDLPELEVGDWLYFDNTGAYSRSVATGYNGFELPICYYFIKDSDSAALFKQKLSSETILNFDDIFCYDYNNEPKPEP